MLVICGCYMKKGGWEFTIASKTPHCLKTIALDSGGLTLANEGLELLSKHLEQLFLSVAA